MSLIKCYECKKEISSAAASCPHCGAKAKTGNQGCFAGVATVFIFLVLGFIYVSEQSSKPSFVEKSNARAAIELCWDDYEKKSNSESEKLLIAKTCELLEEEFKNKYRSNP